MLIASSSKSEYRPFSPISFSIIVAFFLNTFFAANGLPHFDEANFLITLVVISFISKKINYNNKINYFYII